MKKFVLLLPFALFACKSQGAPVGGEPTSAKAATTPTGTIAAAGPAALGAPAPDFELTDLDGKSMRLSSFRGKRVVLEWFNPGCPFVKAAHTKGSLKDFPKKAIAEGATWLAINSGGSGKQGFGVEANKQGKTTFAIEYPILLDPEGKVGKLYGATNTPHMFVIDEKGNLVYRGAIDNSPDGEGDSPEDGKLVNWVGAALADLAAGRAVQKSETKAYGCSVKYASQ
jgi:peroxiredoxin